LPTKNTIKLKTYKSHLSNTTFGSPIFFKLCFFLLFCFWFFFSIQLVLSLCAALEEMFIRILKKQFCKIIFFLYCALKFFFIFF
jgi:hypothetical protein